MLQSDLLMLCCESGRISAGGKAQRLGRQMKKISLLCGFQLMIQFEQLHHINEQKKKIAKIPPPGGFLP